MRLNKYVASTTGLSRRASDSAIAEGRVFVNSKAAKVGESVNEDDSVTLDGQFLSLKPHKTTLLLNKPIGYVCSRNGQGGKTVYDLLPGEYSSLKPVGRLDKDSSGLLLLTDDGELANQLTHPSYKKEKAYEVEINKPISDADLDSLRRGVKLQEGVSRFDKVEAIRPTKYKIILHQGWNRQIRRTFSALGYEVIKLHRTQFGSYSLGNMAKGKYKRC